jgi:hypothetical protein
LAKLTKEAKAFCLRHGIPESRLFDASRFRPRDFKEIMAAEEKWAAYGVTPCYRGHILRDRHNTCLMCDTARVSFMLRSKLSGYLYVAEGGGRQLMKLGFSTEPANRIKIANYEGWGGHFDWKLVAFAWDAEAGRLEKDLLAHFADQQVLLEWERNWQPMVAREAFWSNIEGAIEKIVWLCDGLPEVVI